MNNPMGKVALISLFRNSRMHVARMVAEHYQHDFGPDDVIRICVEGDSDDGTFEALEEASKIIPIIAKKFDQGNQHYGSVINDDRLRCLMRCWNIGLEMFLETDAEYGMIIDSDISMPTNILPTLMAERVDIIAPLLLFERSMFFRDTWGYRDLSGNDFYNHPPFTANFLWLRPFEVSSVGLPFFSRDVIESGIRFDEQEVVGFCKAARAKGHRIFTTPNARVYHPRVVEVPRAHDRDWRVPDHIIESGDSVRIRTPKRRNS
jgi:hypothetical protein